MRRYKLGHDEEKAKRVKLAKLTRMRKANPKVDTPIKPFDPERLSKAIRYLNEHLKR
jgi:hypothetical protein